MKLSLIGICLLSSIIWQGCVAPPVTKEESPSPEAMELIMHYQHYLQEVVNALEKDPDFKKKLETADQDEIRSGKIATELDFVSHHVRTKLDELKRQELERLRTLNQQQHELTDNDIVDDPTHGHLDRSNPHTFEVADLQKLIAKTMETLEEHDRKRREEFKEYELHKEYEKFEKLNHTEKEEREKLEKEYKTIRTPLAGVEVKENHEREEQRKKHEPLHEPGHKAHLEEVWEEQDHMQQDFNPKTFFMMHDLDGDGVWDQNEVKALFVKELNKMYKSGVQGVDMVERAEEMERMRETVFKQMDTNRDGVIEYQEFLMQTQRSDYEVDHGWKGVDEEKPYTDEELDAYIREQQRLHPPPHYQPPGGQGYVPPPPGAYNPNVPPPPGGYPNTYQGQYQQQVHPNMNQGYPPPMPHPQQPPVANQAHPNMNQGYSPPVPHPQQPPVANQAHPNMNQGYPPPVPHPQQPPVANQAQQVPVQAQNQAQAQPPVQVQGQAAPQQPVQQAQPVAGQPNYQQQPPQARQN